MSHALHAWFLCKRIDKYTKIRYPIVELMKALAKWSNPLRQERLLEGEAEAIASRTRWKRLQRLSPLMVDGHDSKKVLREKGALTASQLP